MKAHLANLITISRIFLIPLLVCFFLQEKLHITIILFGFAAITDGIDGYLARYFKQTSALGAWLDPVADKLIVISMLILLLTDQKDIRFAILTMIIICREVMVSALREWMATLDQSHAIKVSNLAKSKTTAQMIAIALFLMSKLSYYPSLITSIAYPAFYIATILTLVSLGDYIWSAFKAIQISKLN